MSIMKDSGIEWVGQIPENWDVVRVKDAFIRKKAKAHQEDPVILSLARDGIKVRDISNNEGQLAENYSEYNPVTIDDILLNPMDLISGDNCNISKIEGVISPAYINLRYKNGINPKFYNYYFKYQYWCKAFFAHGKGVSFENRWTLNNDTLERFPIILPPFEEQEKIADYLDRKCSEIDALHSDIEKQIETLEEYKKSVITEAVTKGLNPDVEMKDSGVEWIGEIPKDWECCKSKYFINIKSGDVLTNFEITDEAEFPVYGGGELIGYYSKYNCDKNNILIGRVGARCGCLTLLSSKAWATDNALIMEVNQNRKYIYYTLLAANINDLNSANAQPLITSTKVKNIKIPIPTLKVQQEIVDYLDTKCTEIDGAIKDKKEQLEVLEEYKKSLIYEYVTGKKEIPSNE